MTSEDAKTFEQWLSWMESCHPDEIELGLERCKGVLQRLLSSKYSFPIITVAGTNGKGSTIATLEALARNANIKPLVYTSPHLLDYRERLRYDGHWLTKEQHIKAFNAVEAARGAVSLTYFEFATLAALKCAEQLQPDILLLETGLGGRLDAVNVLPADIAIITTVDYDHQDWLGDDLISIAREKAGIIHENKTVIIADPDFPDEIIKEVQTRTNKLFIAADNYQYKDMGTEWRWNNNQYGPWQLPAVSFPVSNAAAAIQAWSLMPFGNQLTNDFVQQSLLNISLPCRFDILQQNPDVILDVAHNPQALYHLLEKLKAQPVDGQTHLVIGMLEDKNAAAGLEILKEIADVWYLTDLQSDRGRTANSLKQLINDSEMDKNQLKCYSSPIEAYKAAYENSTRKDRILVTGSFHTVAPVYSLFQIADNKNNN